jgi:hypothetical protein
MAFLSTNVNFQGYSESVYAMVGGASCDVGCMVC